MSLLSALDPIISVLPEVEKPAQAPALKQKLIWTGIALLIFAIMGVITPIGINPEAAQAGWLQNIQVILASKIGTLATLGIGPIVMSSIILQLLNGAQILKFDLGSPEGKKRFQGLQKILAIGFALFEAGVYVSSGFVPALPGSQLLLIGQLAFAAIILIYLDEVVSKHGIGSGVGLFIAAGVSFEIIWRALSPLTSDGGIFGTGSFVGLVPQLFSGLMNGEVLETAVFPLVFTIVVFLVVVYAESMKIEIPLTLGRVRGFGSRYPLKFLYVSNIPVILAAALFANVQMFGVALQSAGFPILGDFDANNQPIGGIAYYLQTPYGALGSVSQATATLGNLNEILHILIFTAAMLAFCIVFGRFWVDMAGQSSHAVASQLQRVGLQIPGFRRDERVTERVLDRYIPIVTILGSMAVGLLAVFADLTGALGSGTGLLLTVGILYRLYEELASQQVFEAHPGLRSLVGG